MRCLAIIRVSIGIKITTYQNFYTYGRQVSQSCPPLLVAFTSMSVWVRLNRSTNPSVWGWYAVVLIFFVPIMAHNSCTKLERKAGPRSKSYWEGTPCRLMTCSTSSRAIWLGPSGQELQTPLATWWGSSWTLLHIGCLGARGGAIGDQLQPDQMFLQLGLGSREASLVILHSC